MRSRVPAGSLRSKRRSRMTLVVLVRATDASGHAVPLHRTRMRAPSGARTERMRTSAPRGSTVPAIRTIGNGFSISGLLLDGGGLPGAGGGGGGGAGAATMTSRVATACFPFSCLTRRRTVCAPGSENDHVAVAPLKSSNLPSPSRSHANCVMETPGDGWDVDVNVTVAPTVGASGVKTNEAVGRSPPGPGWALASTAPATSGDRTTSGTARIRARSAMGSRYPILRRKVPFVNVRRRLRPRRVRGGAT